MAKKRKKVEVIQDIDTSIVKSETERPKCYGMKKSYCMRDLCEDYYDTCKSDNSIEDL